MPVSKRITKALKKRRKHRENITRELSMIKQHMQCGPCATRRGGIARVECDEIGGSHEFDRDETASSHLKSSYKTDYVNVENLNQHMHAESSSGHGYSCEAKQREELLSYGASEKFSSTSAKEKLRKSVSGNACFRNYESRESPNKYFLVNPWAILDHPRTTRQIEGSLEEHHNVSGFGDTHGEKTEKLNPPLGVEVPQVE